MAKPFKKALTISTCLLVAVALTIGAVAWFSGYMKIGTVGFDTSSNANLPKLDMWMYYSENDVQNDDPDSTETEGWVKQDVVNDPSGRNEYIVIPSAGEETMELTTEVDNGDGTTSTVTQTVYTYDIPKLHFGKVDNLVTLNKDNRVLLRFFFDASMLNNTTGKLHDITFTLTYNTEGYTYDVGKESVLDSILLYKEVENGAAKVDLKVPANQDDIANDSSIEASYVLEYREDEPGAMQFLQIRYAVDTEAHAPGEDGFDSIEGLNFHDIVPINCGSAGATKTGSTEAICEACANGTCGRATLDDTDLSILGKQNDDGTYNIGNGFYVYIELAPLLDAFGMQENILDYFVPAYMFFDVKLDVEIG